GRYLPSSDGVSPLKNPIKMGIKSGLAGDRPWRIVAGPELSPSALHCATVPDGPDCQWKDGAFDRIEAKNRAALNVHFDKLDSTAADCCALCGRQDDLVDYKVADRWVTTCRDCRAKRDSANLPSGAAELIASIPDDLSIPEFLRRTPRSYDATPVI